MADDAPNISLDLDGKTYTLGMKDFGGEDDLQIYRETGVTLTEIFTEGKITLFTVAALLWRYRVRNGERRLTFAEVNRQMDFEALSTVTVDDEEDGDAPEA